MIEEADCVSVWSTKMLFFMEEVVNCFYGSDGIGLAGKSRSETPTVDRSVVCDEARTRRGVHSLALANQGNSYSLDCDALRHIDSDGARDKDGLLLGF